MIKDQRPIPGTKELRCGLAEFLEIASHVPLIISVRSGILDFVVKTNVNMFVIYSDEGIDQARYSLSAWKCKGALKELTFKEFLNADKLDHFEDFLQSIKG